MHRYEKHQQERKWNIPKCCSFNLIHRVKSPAVHRKSPVLVHLYQSVWSVSSQQNQDVLVLNVKQLWRFLLTEDRSWWMWTRRVSASQIRSSLKSLNPLRWRQRLMLSAAHSPQNLLRHTMGFIWFIGFMRQHQRSSKGASSRTRFIDYRQIA